MEKHRWFKAREVSGTPDTDYEGANAPAHPKEQMNGAFVPTDEIIDPNSLSPEEAYSLKEELRDNPSALDHLV